jgi:hypothetical protein
MTCGERTGRGRRLYQYSRDDRGCVHCVKNDKLSQGGVRKERDHLEGRARQRHATNMNAYHAPLELRHHVSCVRLVVDDGTNSKQGSGLDGRRAWLRWQLRIKVACPKAPLVCLLKVVSY